MAITVTQAAVENPAGVRFKTVTLTLDASYPTGGYALTPAQLGFVSSIDGIVAGGTAGNTTGVVVGWNPTTQKLQVYLSNGASPALLNEAPNTTALTGQVVTVLAWGR